MNEQIDVGKAIHILGNENSMHVAPKSRRTMVY